MLDALTGLSNPVDEKRQHVKSLLEGSITAAAALADPWSCVLCFCNASIPSLFCQCESLQLQSGHGHGHQMLHTDQHSKCSNAS